MGDEEKEHGGHCMGHGALVERIDGFDDKIKNRLNLMIWILGIGFAANLSFGAYLAGSITSMEKTNAVFNDRLLHNTESIKKLEEQMGLAMRHIYISEVVIQQGNKP